VARTKIQITPAKATAGDRIRIAVDIEVHPGFGSVGGGVSLLHTPPSPNHNITKLSGISPIAMANCHQTARHVSSGTLGSVTSVMCHPSALACPSNVSSDFFGSSLMSSFRFAIGTGVQRHGNVATNVDRVLIRNRAIAHQIKTEKKDGFFLTRRSTQKTAPATTPVTDA